MLRTMSGARALGAWDHPQEAGEQPCGSPSRAAGGTLVGWDAPLMGRLSETASKALSTNIYFVGRTRE